MPKIALSTILDIFTPGGKPSVADWKNIFQSYVHLDNQAAVDGQVVDQKISNYDAAQAARNNDGTINSRGDVFAFLAGMADTAVLKTILQFITNAATWAQLPGKPSSVALSWTEQLIDTSGLVSPPLNQSMQSWLCAPNAGLNNLKYLVIDMKIQRSAFSPASGVVLSCDEIVAVKIAVTPTTSFS